MRTGSMIYMIVTKAEELSDVSKVTFGNQKQAF